MIVRPVETSDLQAVAAIYAHHVLHGFGTFEDAPPSAEEISRRVAAVRTLGLPYLVAEDHGVIGFACATLYRPRPAYRFTAEDSVYVAPQDIGRGVGRALLGEVIARCEAIGLRQLVAMVGDSGNAASLRLHQGLGFEIIGVGRAMGYKQGRWVDVVWLQRALNGGDASPPGGPGLSLAGG